MKVNLSRPDKLALGRGMELHCGKVKCDFNDSEHMVSASSRLDWKAGMFFSLGGFQMLSNLCISKLQNGRWGPAFLF